MLRKLIAFCFIIVFLFLSACISSGPKPDKRITATLELMADNPSEEDINEAILALQRRFEKFNAYPTVERIENSKSLKFTLETHADDDRVRKYLVTPGNLEFYPVVANDDLLPFFEKADAWLMEHDSLDVKPILSKFANFGWGPCFVAEKDTASIGGYLRRNEVLNLLGKDKRRIKFLWGLEDKERNNFPIYAVKTTKSGGAPLDGSVVEQAQQAYNFQEQPTISIQMNKEGAAIWERLTGDAYQSESLIAVVVDGVVYSAPGVVAGPIKGGRSEINGDFTLEEVRDLAASIGSGNIPAMDLLSYSFQPLE